MIKRLKLAWLAFRYPMSNAASITVVRAMIRGCASGEYVVERNGVEERYVLTIERKE